MSSVEHVKRHQEKKKQQGICRDCTKPATHGVYCKGHRDKYNRLGEEIRDQRRLNGLCVVCGDIICKDSRSYCAVHLDYIRKIQALSDVALSGGLKEILDVNRIDKKRLGDIKDEMRKMFDHADFVIEDRDKTIWELRILTQYQMPLQGIGKKFGITRERVRQLESRLTKRALKYLESKGFLTELRSMAKNS